MRETSASDCEAASVLTATRELRLLRIIVEIGLAEVISEIGLARALQAFGLIGAALEYRRRALGLPGQ